MEPIRIHGLEQIQPHVFFTLAQMAVCLQILFYIPCAGPTKKHAVHCFPGFSYGFRYV